MLAGDRRSLTAGAWNEGMRDLVLGIVLADDSLPPAWMTWPARSRKVALSRSGQLAAAQFRTPAAPAGLLELSKGHFSPLLLAVQMHGKA